MSSKSRAWAYFRVETIVFLRLQKFQKTCLFSLLIQLNIYISMHIFRKVRHSYINKGTFSKLRDAVLSTTHRACEVECPWAIKKNDLQVSINFFQYGERKNKLSRGDPPSILKAIFSRFLYGLFGAACHQITI